MDRNFDVVELRCVMMRHLRFHLICGFEYHVTTFSLVIHNSKNKSNVPLHCMRPSDHIDPNIYPIAFHILCKDISYLKPVLK